MKCIIHPTIGETPNIPDSISAGFILGKPIIGAITPTIVITAVATTPARIERTSLFAITNVFDSKLLVGIFG